MTGKASSSSYRADIDGLRAIAILVVVFYHAHLALPGGYLGVDIFFVISGYLITQVIAGDVQKDTFAYREFWERRARRLLPALAAVLLCTAVGGWFLLLPDELRDLGAVYVSQSLLLANVYFWRAIRDGYFGDSPDLRPALHLWSLAVEEQFYLFYPLLLGWAFKWTKHAKSWGRFSAVTVWVAAAFGASLALSIAVTANHPAPAFFLLPTRAWELLLGALGALHKPQFRSPTSRETLAALGLLMIGGSVLCFDESTPIPGSAALFPCLGAYLCLTTNVGGLTGCGRILAFRPLVFVGLVSYSWYLWHWPLFAYLSYSLCGFPVLGLRWTAFFASFLLAVLSWRFVETPFRVRRVCRSRSSMFQFGFGSLLASMAIGLSFYFSEGFPGRCPPEANKLSRARDEEKKDLILESTRVGSDRVVELGSKAVSPNCLLWGDSHAGALFPVVDALGKKFGVSALAVTHGATPPLLDYQGKAKSYSLDAAQSKIWAQGIQRLVVSRKIRYVILAANWRLYGDIDSALWHSVRSFQSLGVTVCFVKDVPQPGFLVPRALALGRWGRRMSPTLLTFHPRDDHAQDELLRQIGLRTDDFIVVDGSRLLTEESGQCRLALGDEVLYRDADHLTVTGSLYLAPVFESLFASMKK